MSLLEIENLTHSFGETSFYKKATFTLNKGEHIGIVGQNGAGKSTLKQKRNKANNVYTFFA